MPKKDKTKLKKDKLKIKNKNKNKNTVIVNVNSHNKRKAIQHKTDSKNPPTQMPYVINNSPSPQQQIQPIIIQQPAQPSYLHYQNPNPIHLGSQNANPVNASIPVNSSVPVNGYVPSNNIFQSPRRMPVRIPPNNVIEIQTDLTGDTLEEYQKRLEEDRNNFLEFREITSRDINALQNSVNEERNNVDDMATYINKIRNENKDLSSKADSLFNQLNKEREENQLLNREFNERLKMEEEEKFLLKQNIVKNEMEKNKLKFIIQDNEKVGVLREGRRNNSPKPDIAPKNSIEKKQTITNEYITPPPVKESNYLDTDAGNLKASEPVIVEFEDRPMSDFPVLKAYEAKKLQKKEKQINYQREPIVESAELSVEERNSIIKLLVKNKDFIKKYGSGKSVIVTPLEEGNYELLLNSNKNLPISNKTLLSLAKTFLHTG